MIVHRLRSFPNKYQCQISNFSEYCDSMSKNGEAASHLELQAVADICFSVVECYYIGDFLVPVHIIRPLRVPKMPKCTSCIRLWIQPSHCMALLGRQSLPLIKNIFDDPSLLQAVS